MIDLNEHCDYLRLLAARTVGFLTAPEDIEDEDEDYPESA